MERGRRIVLVDRQGNHGILGVAYSQPNDMLQVGDVLFSLIKVRRTMYLYREIVPPMGNAQGDGTFTQGQR